MEYLITEDESKMNFIDNSIQIDEFLSIFHF